jgi:hypothetical protein
MEDRRSCVAYILRTELLTNDLVTLIPQGHAMLYLIFRSIQLLVTQYASVRPRSVESVIRRRVIVAVAGIRTRFIT